MITDPALPNLDPSWPDQAPCGMLLLDADGLATWCNATLERLSGMTRAEILGLSAEQLGRFVAPEGKLILNHGGRERWLHLSRQPDGLGRTLLTYQDLAREQELELQIERLSHQVEDLKLTDDLTGLLNRRAVTQALDQQISRSRRYQNPLSVVLVHVGLQPEATAPTDDVRNKILLGVSRFLRDRLRWVDQIGRWENNVFVMVLPETSEEEAHNLVEKIIDENGLILLPAPFTPTDLDLAFGIGRWRKGDDIRTLLRSVLAKLQTEDAA